jgi:hypothetical protein
MTLRIFAVISISCKRRDILFGDDGEMTKKKVVFTLYPHRFLIGNSWNFADGVFSS